MASRLLLARCRRRLVRRLRLLGRCPRLLSAARRRGPKDRLRSPRRAGFYLTRTCVPPFEYVRPNQLDEIAQVPAWIFFAKKLSYQAQQNGRSGCRPCPPRSVKPRHRRRFQFMPGNERVHVCLLAGKRKVEKGSPEAAVPQPLIYPAAGDGPPYVAPQAISIPARQKGSACCFFG